MTVHLVRRANEFDVVVTENMFGDILSDLAGELAGSLGIAPSLNASQDRAMAQAAHGSAPDIAGQDRANPIAMILSTAMLFDWLGARYHDDALSHAASLITGAVEETVAQGISTPDMGGDAGCQEFAEAVAATTKRAVSVAAHLTGTQRDTFGTQRELVVDGQRLRYHDITSIAPPTLPVSLRILLENVLRFDDGTGRAGDEIRAIVDGADIPVDLYASRVFLHDTNGVPTLVDLAALRDGMAALGGDPARVNPVIASEMVVDHSVIADVYGTTGRHGAQRGLGVCPQWRTLPLPAMGTAVAEGLRGCRRPAPGSCTRSTLNTLPVS